MRILPRLPLYSTAAAAAATVLVVLTSSPAVAQEDLQAWATRIHGDGEDVNAPCEVDETKDGEALHTEPWHISQSGLDIAHSHNTGKHDEDGSPVRVAVIDSGTYADHPTFGGQVVEGGDPWDPATNGQCDTIGHGTGVAGVIAGGHDETTYQGIAPDAEIIPIRMFPEGDENSLDGKDPNTSRALADSINQAVLAGAEVINVSIVTADTTELQAAIEAAYEANVTIVASSGNASVWMDEPDDYGDDGLVIYPAAYEHVITVAASDPAGFWWAKSNFGSAVDLVAPGDQITLAAPGGTGYFEGSGTSYAAPQVTGAAALLRGEFGDLATPEWIRERLIDTAVPPGDGYNLYQGYGLLNIPQALTATFTIEAEDEETEPAEDNSPQIEFITVGDDPLKEEKVMALAAAGGSIVLVVLILVARKLLPSGKRRGWRPGTRGGSDVQVRI